MLWKNIGEEIPDIDDFMNKLDFERDRTHSFIRLHLSTPYSLFSCVSGRCLTIDMVQRANDWDLYGSFCNPVLYSSIASFLASQKLRPNQIDGVQVLNKATPRMAGCKCYIRTLVSLGFTRINGRLFHTEDDLQTFCTEELENMDPSKPDEYLGLPGPAVSPLMPRILVPHNITDILSPAIVFNRLVDY